MGVVKGNAVVGQSGGPTVVINQSLVGVIQEAKKHGHIERLLGSKFGVRGIINEDFVPLKHVPEDVLEKVAQTPAAALGSTRDKPDQEYCKKIFASFAKHDVHYFFYIGGNDSADTARIVNELARDANYELRTIHIPKTIDNDLRVHDHTPGYGSAAKFVAAAMMGDNYDNKSLPGIKIDVVMGRHAGFLTAASVLARHDEDDGPHLIYVPESPLSEGQFLGDVERVFRKYGRCLIAVSEGVMTPEGVTWAEKLAPKLERDAHGNVQLSGTGTLGDSMAALVTRALQTPGGKKLRVRADTFGYLQRSFPGCVSEVDAAEARLVGQMAMRYSAAEDVDGSVAMRRVGAERYEIETFLTPLDSVARVTKELPKEYIVNGNDISQAFIDYARPLVGTLPVVGSLNGVSMKK